MTPEEHQLVADLFDRLATLEDAQRDPEAERAIRDGLRQAPNAVYALVQTVLVQDEALKRADSRIHELEAQLGMRDEPPRQGGFLDTMRDTIFGRREEPRSSVPNVRPGEAPMGVPPGFRTDAQPMGAPPGYGPGGQAGGYPEPQQRGFGGGSFLGTAAAAAAGVIGGSLLLDSIRGMMGNRQGGFGLTDPAGASEQGASPWSVGGGGSDELARQLGRDEIGGGSDDPYRQGGQGVYTDASDASADDAFIDDSSFDSGGDYGGDFGGDGGGGGGD